MTDRCHDVTLLLLTFGDNPNRDMGRLAAQRGCRLIAYPRYTPSRRSDSYDNALISFRSLNVSNFNTTPHLELPSLIFRILPCTKQNATRRVTTTRHEGGRRVETNRLISVFRNRCPHRRHRPCRSYCSARMRTQRSLCPAPRAHADHQHCWYA